MNAPIEAIRTAEEVNAAIAAETAEGPQRKAREPRLIDAVINPDGKPGIQGWDFAALQHGIKNGPSGHAKALAFKLVNSKDGLVQKMADEKRRQILRGTAGSTESYREVVEFIIIKGERGKREVFTPNFFRLVQAYADAPVESVASANPQSRNTPAKVAEFQAQARKALEFAEANVRHNQELSAARKGSANGPAAAAVAAIA
jgi:hypothetical protein